MWCPVCEREFELLNDHGMCLGCAAQVDIDEETASEGAEYVIMAARVKIGIDKLNKAKMQPIKLEYDAKCSGTLPCEHLVTIQGRVPVLMDSVLIRETCERWALIVPPHFEEQQNALRERKQLNALIKAKQAWKKSKTTTKLY